MTSRSDSENDGLVQELYSAILDLLPPDVRKQASLATLQALMSGWCPQPASVERVDRLARELAIRRKSSAAFDLVSRDKATAARVQRPGLIALKQHLFGINPRLSDAALNQRTAEAATHFLGKAVSPSQVRRATQRRKKKS
jgi:hypothetical protein